MEGIMEAVVVVGAFTGSLGIAFVTQKALLELLLRAMRD